jgi:hypothetical protein
MDEQPYELEIVFTSDDRDRGRPIKASGAHTALLPEPRTIRKIVIEKVAGASGLKLRLRLEE